MDLALAAEEDEHVAVAFGRQLVDGVDHGPDLVAIVGRIVGVVAAERAVPHLDRIRATLDHEHRCRACRRSPKCSAKRAVSIVADVTITLQVRASRQQLLEVAEDEVDVEAALVGLVDDQRVVAAQVAVAMELVEQDAVGHHPHQRRVADLVVEPHRVADAVADRGAQLVGDALGDRAGGHAARLGVTDHPVDAAPGLEAQLGQLGALARSGLAGDDDHLVLADGGDQLVAPGRDRERLRVLDRCAPPASAPRRPPGSASTSAARAARGAVATTGRVGAMAHDGISERVAHAGATSRTDCWPDRHTGLRGDWARAQRLRGGRAGLGRLAVDQSSAPATSPTPSG